MKCVCSGCTPCYIGVYQTSNYIFKFISADYVYLNFNEYSNVSVYRYYIWFLQNWTHEVRFIKEIIFSNCSLISYIP